LTGFSYQPTKKVLRRPLESADIALRPVARRAVGRIWPHYVVPRLPEFFARYPDLALDLDVSERHVNLIEEGVDVAIRIGFLADSSLLARESAAWKLPPSRRRNISKRSASL
jgi:DNA-binding transcriptional LysR family regulator